MIILKIFKWLIPVVSCLCSCVGSMAQEIHYPVEALDLGFYDYGSSSAFPIGTGISAGFGPMSIVYFPDTPACYLTVDMLTPKEIDDFNLNADPEGRVLLAHVEMADGNEFMAPVKAVTRVEDDEKGIIKRLVISLGEAAYSSEIAEIGTDWNAWSTLKFLNSRLCRHDIKDLKLEFFSPDTGIVLLDKDVILLGGPPPNSIGFYNIFCKISEITGDEDFYNYSWETPDR